MEQEVSKDQCSYAIEANETSRPDGDISWNQYGIVATKSKPRREGTKIQGRIVTHEHSSKEFQV